MFEPGVNGHDEALCVLERLAVSALAQWRVVPKAVSLIKFRENAVFRIVTHDDVPFALRVHRSGYHSDDELLSELQWMAALEEAGVNVPRVVPAFDGRLFVSAWVEGLRAPLQLDLFEWIDGSQLGTSESGLGGNREHIASMYRTLGNIAARVHNQATSWRLPPDFRRHRWDVEGLVGEQPLWGRFWELASLAPQQRELLVAARERVCREMTDLAKTVDMQRCFSLIHADFVPENLLISGGKVRLLDFDDAGFGWHLFELATALYFIQHDPQYEIAKAALIEGYRELRALPDAHLDKLPVFMMARGFSYLGWVHTRPDSQVSQELTPYLIGLACGFAERFMAVPARP